MRVNFRSFEGGNSHTAQVPFPATPIRTVRGLIATAMQTVQERVRLIYGGKQLEDDQSLFQCNFKDGDTILVMFRTEFQPSAPDTISHAPASSTVLGSTAKNNLGDTTVENDEALQNSNHRCVSMSDLLMNSSASTSSTPPEEGTAEVETAYFCTVCKNMANKDCRNCGCHICGGKHDEDRTLACDECENYFHMSCMDPPITEVPEGEWYCSGCANDPAEVFAAGQKRDMSLSKKAKMPSATQQKQWGQGKACVGLSKKCTVVGDKHVGPIPGVPVGSSWRFRINVSESGVHRPPVAGIAGTAATGAVSIVLAAGYPEDKDNGLEFTYTGAGGRNLKDGNKRVAQQTSDQELKGVNEALARTCDCPFNMNGGTARDWSKSRGVRVIRSAKLKRHNPEFAPEEGNRYDGIYKIVKYWPEKGDAGYIVWRYLMRRDDPEPAPWTPEGKKRIKDLGLVMYDPDAKTEERTFVIPKSLETLMKADTANSRSWHLIFEKKLGSLSGLLDAVFDDVFLCPICKDKIENPVTTSCSHNICAGCLAAAFKSNGKSCPACRADLSNDEVRVNENLKTVFKGLVDPALLAEIATSAPSASPSRSIKPATTKTTKAPKVVKEEPVKEEPVDMDDVEVVPSQKRPRARAHPASFFESRINKTKMPRRTTEK